METDEGEFIISGSSGSPDDAAFDGLVGVIEEFMMTFDMDGALGSLPSYASIPSDHERHTVYRTFLADVEASLDAHVVSRCPQMGDLSAVGRLLQERQGEISEEVWEFVSEGCLDFVSFDEQWRLHSP